MGLDVHQASIVVAVAEDDDQPPQVWDKIPNEPSAVRKLVNKLGHRRCGGVSGLPHLGFQGGGVIGGVASRRSAPHGLARLFQSRRTAARCGQTERSRRIASSWRMSRIYPLVSPL